MVKHFIGNEETVSSILIVGSLFLLHFSINSFYTVFVVRKEVVDFINQGSEKGISATELKEALSVAKVESKPLSLPNSINVDLKRITASQILLFIGALITIIAGIIYITINWNQWGPFFRVLAIFIPMLLAFVAGVWLWSKEDHLKSSISFLFTGSLLFPLFLIIAFREFKLFDGSSFELQGLVISFLSLMLYLVISFLFRYQIWSLLYSIAGFSSYYFLLTYLKVNFLGNYTLSWMSLILSLGYFFLSFWLIEKKMTEHANFPFAFGAGLSLFSIVYLIFTHSLESDATWYLFIPTISFFMLGYLSEYKSYKSYASPFYFLGSVSLLATTLKLTVGMRLAALVGVDYRNFTDSNMIYGLFIVVFGIIHLLFSLALEKARKYNLIKLAEFSIVFQLVGTFAILGGIFYAGLAGKKFLAETLLLLTSLGFIFSSIFKKSEPFLYFGTLFLVIYIF